jgi:ABC-2 type transport system permease protein
MFTVPTALAILWVYPVEAPASWASLFGFLAAMIFAFCIFAAINFITGTFAVYLQSILGLIRAKYFLVEILSGLIIPINFFPETLARISAWLPFQHISYTPLMIYMGKLHGHELRMTLLIELVWSVVLLWAGHLMWRKATRRLTVQGG